MKTTTIDETLYNTAPDETGRPQVEMNVYEVLNELDIPFTRMDHEAAATISDCQDVDKKLGIKLCKNLFLCNSQKTKFYLLMMPGEKKFMTKDLSAQINSARLSFANEKYMMEFLGLSPGSVTIMGLMNDTGNQVQLIIDRDLLELDYLGCHPCVNTASLKLKTADVLEKFLPHVKHVPIFVNL